MASEVSLDDWAIENKPPFFDGQRLSQPEFHRIYKEYSGDKKIELIFGSVYIRWSRMRLPARMHGLLSSILILYEAGTRGVEALSNATTILDDQNEPQPDLQLRLLSDFGGNTVITSEGFLSGASELIIEISDGSPVLALELKRDLFQAAGVKEYVAVSVDLMKICWFVWPDGERAIDADGVLRCATFPGLWIDTSALLEDRLSDVMMGLNQGLKTPEHAAFVAKLRSQADHK